MPVKIVVISDTHLRRENTWLPPEVEKALAKADLVVHCGDFEAPFVYERIKKQKELIAVCGNMDGYELQSILPQTTTFEVEGHKIGVIHGFGPPQGLEIRIKPLFTRVEAILYGHSHTPKNTIQEGILFFNPGSPTDKRHAPFNSYGVLEIGKEIKGEIIVLGGEK